MFVLGFDPLSNHAVEFAHAGMNLRYRYPVVRAWNQHLAWNISGRGREVGYIAGVHGARFAPGRIVGALRHQWGQDGLGGSLGTHLVDEL